MRPARRAQLLVLVCAVVLGLLTGVVAVLLGTRSPQPEAAAAAPAAVVPAEPPAVRALRDWDRRRARAYARGDPATLARLYASGSRTGRADLAVLRSYRRRGLRVTGLRTQLLGARVLHETGDRLVLRVTDALVGGAATDGRHRWRLPRDQPSTRRVVLVRRHGDWLVREAYH